MQRRRLKKRELPILHGLRSHKNHCLSRKVAFCFVGTTSTDSQPFPLPVDRKVVFPSRTAVFPSSFFLSFCPSYAATTLGRRQRTQPQGVQCAPPKRQKTPVSSRLSLWGGVVTGNLRGAMNALTLRKPYHSTEPLFLPHPFDPGAVGLSAKKPPD